MWEPGAWARAQRIATSALGGSVYRPVGLALNYHTTAIRPYWAPSLVRQAVVGAISSIGVRIAVTSRPSDRRPPASNPAASMLRPP
jgi:hypothetical protein